MNEMTKLQSQDLDAYLQQQRSQQAVVTRLLLEDKAMSVKILPNGHY